MDKISVDQENPRSFETPSLPNGGFDAAPIDLKDKRRGLEILLGDKNLDPERAEAIRKQIADIDSGKVLPIPPELGSQSFLATEALNSGRSFSKESLENMLNGNGNFKFVKADEKGAGFNEMDMLIEEEKRKAQNN